MVVAPRAGLHAPVAWLEGIFVSQGYRQWGLGNQLLAAVEKWAKKRGLSELGSDAYIDNERSIVAHAAWGFKETGRVVQFKKPT